MYKKLLSWSHDNHRNLPWRQKRTLYTTLVSEIMLQQTTVGTVLNHYPKFITKYKNLKTLASSTDEQLQIDWKGLGYYRRARNLKSAAKYINESFHGRFPKKIEQLLEIPGIGDYTANALMAIGRDLPALPLDANLERVLSRLYGVQETSKSKLHKKLHTLYQEEQILHEQKDLSPREISEALMDLGREFCRANKTHCPLCPMNKNCLAFKSGSPLKYPGLKKAEKTFYQLKLARIIVKNKNQVLAYQKPKGTWLEGQMELPTFLISSEKKNFEPYPILKNKLQASQIFKTGITQYKIENHIIILSKKEFDQLSFPHSCRYINLDHENNLSTASTKALKKID